MWKKLVGDEGNVIACLAEHLREERIVAPFTLLAHNMGRKHVLEYETGQVPAGYHIGKLGQFAALLQCHLQRGGIHEVAILLGMMATEALTDNQYDVRRAIAAAIYLHLMGSMDELGNLMCRQLVGVDTEVESVDWQIEHGMVFLRQDMLHFTNGASIHELVISYLVMPGSTDARNQERQTEDTEGGWHGSRHTGNGHQPFFERSQFEYGDEEDVNLDELLAEDGDENLDESQKQDPAHTTEENLGRDEG